MGVTTYDSTAAAFRPEAAHDYELSILTGMDSFAYIIRDRNTNQLLAYRSLSLPAVAPTDWAGQLADLMDADERLRDIHRYGKVLLGWDTPALTLIPDALFAPEQLRSYLEQLTVVGLEDEVRYEHYSELGGAVIYGGRQEQLAEARRLFGSDRLQHYAGGLLVAWAARSRRLRESAVACCIRDRRLFLAGHHAGQLVYFNTFTWESSQDAVYYLLLAYAQSELTPDAAPLYLSGEVSSTDELYYQFYRYVRELHWSAYPTPPAPAPGLEALPGHLYFDLLCLS